MPADPQAFFGVGRNWGAALDVLHINKVVNGAEFLGFRVDQLNQ